MKVHYYHGNDNDQLKVSIKALFGLFTKKIDIPVIKVSKDSTSLVYKEKKMDAKNNEDISNKKITLEELISSYKNMKELIKHINNANPIIKRFLRRIVIHQFVWHSAVGTKDAALTGKVTGVAWGIKGLIQMVIYRFFSVKCNLEYSITPHFDRSLSVTDFHCILKVRIGHAILTALKLLRHWKGGKVNLSTSSQTKQKSANNESV